MLYIHESTCISSQHSFPEPQLSSYIPPTTNKLIALEPAYNNIPEKILRRMGKAVRLGVGVALPLVQKFSNPDGIIVGTANGGMEDCIKFLTQIIEYDEGLLTPTNFVQSTSNAIAGQVGLMLKNTGYNITHVHRGHAFENALLDAAMFLTEHQNANLLVGAVDEISAYNYNIDLLAGWFKDPDNAAKGMYKTDSPGSFAGEGAAMFHVSSQPLAGSVKLVDLLTITSEDVDVFHDILQNFILRNNLHESAPDIFLSGENGDNRVSGFFEISEQALKEVPVLRFKHISGEFSTASSIALWLSWHILKGMEIPEHMWKYNLLPTKPRSILIYNNHKKIQHSLILCRIDS